VGLGNPGPDFQNTRHNAGFWFVDLWAANRGLVFRKAWFQPYLWCSQTIGDDRLVLIKPLTYMNLSGAVVPALLSRFHASAEDLLIAFDQMDLPPGRVRLKPKGSHAGHNGLRSIEAALGHSDYYRLAVGIGRPAKDIVEYVLGSPEETERESIATAVTRAVSAAEAAWTQGWDPLLNAVNQPVTA
jgi:PTH1 family peptidyl-tRNA hydrolase